MSTQPQSANPDLKRAVVLDIDNTLTPPRRPLQAEMAVVLKRLTVPFFLGAGGDLRLVTEQFIEPLQQFGYKGRFGAFLCNGSTRFSVSIDRDASVELIRDFKMADYLGADQFSRLIATLEQILDLPEFQLPPPMRVLGERIVNRSSMINVAPIGRPTERLTDEAHQNRDAFRQFDLDTAFRKRFLAHLVTSLAQFSAGDLVVTLGGETSFDLVIRGNDKSYPMRTLLQEGFHRLWYVGDALFEGGNDQAVIDFIHSWKGSGSCPVTAIPVDSWRSTIGVLQALGIVRD